MAPNRHATSANQQASNNNITSQPEQEHVNPVYSETDHYYSSADFPHRNASDHYYSNPDVSARIHHYHTVDSSKVEGEPFYSTLTSNREPLFRSQEILSHPASKKTPNRRQHHPHGRTTDEDYSEPADSTNMKCSLSPKLPALYHVLDTGATSVNSGLSYNSPPPVYQVLEPDRNAVIAREARMPVVCGPLGLTNLPPDYDSIDDYAVPT